MSMVKRAALLIWHKLGSIHLTVFLCLMLTLDLFFGYLCLNRHTSLFAPLNEIGLAEWLATYGQYNLLYTAWFFVLLFLLTLLGINTFVCTTDRIVRLIRSRSHFTRLHLVFRFAPHVMHYAVIIILGGYLCSYLFSQVIDSRTLITGRSLTLPGTEAQVTFTSLNPVYYEGGRLEALKDRVIQPYADLVLAESGKRRNAVIGYNSPVRFGGYSIYLKHFYPKKKSGGMSRRIRITLSIRKDPGVPLYLAGIFLFTAGLVMYLTEWILFKKV